MDVAQCQQHFFSAVDRERNDASDTLPMILLQVLETEDVFGDEVDVVEAGSEPRAASSPAQDMAFDKSTTMQTGAVEHSGTNFLFGSIDNQLSHLAPNMPAPPPVFLAPPEPADISLYHAQVIRSQAAGNAG